MIVLSFLRQFMLQLISDLLIGMQNNMTSLFSLQVLSSTLYHMFEVQAKTQIIFMKIIICAPDQTQQLRRVLEKGPSTVEICLCLQASG